MTSEVNCIFCKICNNQSPANILYTDDKYVVFTDIKPASDFHALVVPKTHIRDVTVLKHEDLPVLREMIEVGGKVLLEQHSGDMNDVRLGFHWPPFTSVRHLHLHVISPTSKMGFVHRLMFKENSYWFVTPQYVINRLEKMQ